jgi:hypothetical protein
MCEPTVSTWSLEFINSLELLHVASCVYQIRVSFFFFFSPLYTLCKIDYSYASECNDINQGLVDLFICYKSVKSTYVSSVIILGSIISLPGLSLQKNTISI